MNNEDFVSFEIAQALARCGYDGQYDYMYATMNFCYGSSGLDFHTICIGERILNYVAKYKTYEGEDAYRGIPCPTLAQAQKWLRDVKDYIIVIYPSTDFTDSNDMCVPFLDDKWFFELWVKAERISLIETASEDYPTYESALSAGIEAALKLIEEGEE